MYKIRVCPARDLHVMSNTCPASLLYLLLIKVKFTLVEACVHIGAQR